MNTTTNNNPMCWVIMHNTAILGVYTRPEWAALKVADVLNDELTIRIGRAERYKHVMPDGVYILRDGYDPETGAIDMLYHPTLDQIEQVIKERSNSMGVTVCGVNNSTYALNVVPVVMDA